MQKQPVVAYARNQVNQHSFSIQNTRQQDSKPAHGERQDQLDLAIVILSYNTAELLRNCLRSLLAGAGEFRMQVCVVDNASTDDSRDMVCSEFPDVHLITNQANIGYSAGNNVGLRWFGFQDQTNGQADAQATAKLPRYVLLLNPDTLLPPTALAEMLAFMDAHPRIGIAGPRVRRPDGSLDRACRRSFPTPQVSFYRMIGLSRLFPRSKR